MHEKEKNKQNSNKYDQQFVSREPLSKNFLFLVISFGKKETISFYKRDNLDKRDKETISKININLNQTVLMSLIQEEVKRIH